MNFLAGISEAVKAVFPTSSRAIATHAEVAKAQPSLTSHAIADAQITMVGEAFNLEERQVQIQAGVTDKEIARYTRFIRASMPEQHRTFFNEREVMYMSVGGEAGMPPAVGVLVGPTGFMSTPDENTVKLDLSVAAPYGFDRNKLRPGALVGFLGMQHETRRRNRLNGHITDVTESSVMIAVDQSFGNCPKYIQKRPVGFDPEKLAAVHSSSKENYENIEETTQELSGAARDIVTSADTFFIASAAHRTNSDGVVQPPHGVDVSHRGGPEGFVKVSSDEKQLKWADYKGNNFFMTLGNISATGLVSLLFCDYISGAASVVAGHARIDWDDTSLDGAQRTVVVDIDTVKLLPRGAIPFKSGPIEEWSPHNPKPAAELA